MSPAKKQPRPVTRWFFRWEDGSLGKIAETKRVDKREVRCRVVPIRPATDAEIERLAQALYEACGRNATEYKWKSITRESVRWTWLAAARLAWKRGAR